MEDTPEQARKLINPLTQSLLYSFNGSEAYSPGTIVFPVRTDLFNVVTKFCVLNVRSPDNAILERPWIHMIREV